MPAVCRRNSAIAAVEVPVIRICPAVIRGCNKDKSEPCRIGDAMRPGVIPVNREATCCPALNGKKQAVIAGCTSTFQVIHKTEILSECRILQAEAASLVGIGCGGAS